MKKMAAILSLVVFSSTVFASDNTGKLDLSMGYVSAPENQAGLEKDLSTANKNAKVSCTDVVTVHTGGEIGQATGGRCSFDGQPAVWACRNDSVGNTAKQQFQDRVSDGFALSYLIITSCIGG